MKFDYVSQPKETVKACNLCGGRRFDPVGDWDRFGLPVKSVRCHACGLIFLNPRMTREAYGEFYRDGHYRELLGRNFAQMKSIEALEPFQNSYARNLCRWLEKHIATREMASVLDVGGSSGVVAAAIAKRFGLEATVLEPSEEEGKKAQVRGLRLWQGCIEEFEPDGERFDLVLLCQTIEHLLDIAGSLRTIHALLEDDGLFFADVVTDATKKIDHAFYLSRETATAFFTGARFRVLDEAPGGRHYRFVCEKA